MFKLDMYNYTILPGVIRVYVNSKNDPALVDILSGIDRSNNRIFADGVSFVFTGNSDLYSDSFSTYLELQVEQPY